MSNFALWTDRGKLYVKYLKTRQHTICVVIVFVWALCLRLFLAASSWPLLNSDEGTMGIMALHIQQGDRPIFFYGQHYMGPLQAYIAAGLFSFFGASIFSLRLAIILLYSAFLLTMYVLTRALYTKRFALFVMFLLSLGSNVVFSRQLSAIGGYSETLFFSALAFALALWLAASASLTGSSYDRKSHAYYIRVGAYCVWGLAVGLGLWSDLLILPVVACSGLFLVLFCWRELLRGFAVPLLLCVAIGAAPLISYNLHAASNVNSWATLMAQQGHIEHTWAILMAQLEATIGYSLPAITGSPLCHHAEFQFIDYLGFQPSHPADASCTTIGTLWSGAYLSLFLIAGIMIAVSVYKGIKSYTRATWTKQKHSLFVRNAMRLCILFSSLLTLYLYTNSKAPLSGPSILSRYLVCLWIATPVVIWPLWKGIASIGQLEQEDGDKRSLWMIVVGRTFCMSALVWLAGVMLFGTYITINEAPIAVAANHTELLAIAGLLKDRITHVYSGYWTCDRIAFESQDHIICAVLKDDLMSPGLNKYKPYYTTVKGDPYSSYIFQRNGGFLYSQPSDLVLIEKKLAHTGRRYRLLFIQDYAVYEPVQ